MPRLIVGSRCYWLLLLLLVAAAVHPPVVVAAARHAVGSPPKKQQRRHRHGLLASPPPPIIHKRDAAQPVPAATKNVARRVLEGWHATVPKPLRFFVSGRCGDVCFYGCEQIVSHALHRAPPAGLFFGHKDSLSFFLGYLLHVIPQHALHALLVYGWHTIDSPETYRRTLWGMYQALLASAVGSTLLHAALLQVVPKMWAFVLTLALFSALNYFWIGWIVRRANPEAADRHRNRRR